MNSFFENHATAIVQGLVTGLVVLVLNAIGHYGFGAPEIPFVYGVALILAVVVATFRSMGHPHDDPYHGV